MFDWDDEEIASIIWGKESENEEHIVSYPDETYGEHSNVKLTQKRTLSKNITNSGQGKNTQYDTHGKVSTDGFVSLLNLSSSKAIKLDHEHTDEKAQVENGSQIFDNQAEERDGSNFVDYGWANVGKFDDLDRILSNHDLELWSSTKDVIGCPENSESLSISSPSLNLGNFRSNCQHFGTKPGFTKDEKQTNCGKIENMHKEKCAIVKKEPQGQYTQHNKNSPLRMARTETYGYMQFINALPSPRGYNMMINQYSALPHQQSSYVPQDSPLSMTPQEKIEKLRRRQQMRALLAIRKQQQEIRQQVDRDDHSNLELCSKESELQFARTRRVEIDQSDARSPLEQSDSDTIPVMMDKTVLADSVVHQLQTVIAGVHEEMLLQLGIHLRICIKDSLFRLAQGALQRKNACTNRRSIDEPSVVMEGVSSTKSSAAGETKTNPIDRVVARLLFHTLPGQNHCELTTTPTIKCLNESYKDNQFSSFVKNKQKNPFLENESNSKKPNGSGVENEASNVYTSLKL